MGDQSAMSEMSGVSTSTQESPQEAGTSVNKVLVVVAVAFVAIIVAAAVLLKGSSASSEVPSDDADSPGGSPSGGSSYGGGSTDGTDVPAEPPAPDTTTTTSTTTTSTTTTTTPQPFEVNCNFTLMADAQGGEFTSDNYPNNYKRESATYWCIRTAPGTCIKLEFLDFQLEEKGTWSNDYVEIYNGGSGKDPVLGYFFGKSAIPPPVTSTVPMMTVFFDTDPTIVEKGFKAKYSSVPCTTLLAVASTIRSLKVSSDEPNFVIGDTTWLLKAHDGRVRLTFDSLDLDACGDYEYVTVFDGNNTSAPIIGKYRGKEVPPEVTSSSNDVLLQFHSECGDSKGFSAKYAAI